MKTIEIKHRYTGAVLYTTEVEDDDPCPVRTAVVRAVERDADLGGAYLGGAYLGGAYLGGADLGGAYLRDAYLGGADLGGADLGGAYLRDAYLGDAYLGGADLGGAYLRGAYLGGADLGGADLGGADLGGADLGGADLGGAYLGGAYLGDAGNVPTDIEQTNPPEPYVRATTDEQRRERNAKRMERFRARHPEVPVIEQLDRKILDVITTTGKLEMSQWHTCETTHCRAGWAITLAGEAGKELEHKHGPHHAGRLIYLVSTGRAPHFFATNERAMEDIKRCAEESP